MDVKDNERQYYALIHLLARSVGTRCNASFIKLGLSVLTDPKRKFVDKFLRILVFI